MRRGGQSKFANEDDFPEKCVDLFYRANKERKEKIAFEDLTAFLIDHEIETTN